MRTSSYLIPVKLESEPDKYMLIHGYTGAIDIATESLLRKIQTIASGTDLSSEMLQTLQKRGYITTKTPEEEYAYAARMAKALHQKAWILHKVFTLVVTYNCNFRCPYCFEKRDVKDGLKQIVFTKEMVDSVFQIINQIQPHKELRKNILTLYGGEPLLVENKEIVTYIIKKGTEEGYKFDITTNGYDLDAYIDLLTPDFINKIQVTVDGIRKTHNQRRPHYIYCDTFDKIVANIGLALRKGVAIGVRMNVDNKNLKEMAELRDFFREKGFFNYSNFDFYSALIHNNDSILSEEYEKLDIAPVKSYLEKYKEFNVEELANDYGITRKIYLALKNGSPISFHSIFCSSQYGGYVFDPLGNIYPCWEVLGKQEALIGHYFQGKVVWNESIINQWHKLDISQRQSCRHCSYAFLCGGGCPAHYENGKCLTHCVYYKSIFSNAVNRAYVRWKALNK